MSFDSFHLDKQLFTEDDFEMMGWHDNQIHAIAFGPGHAELSFDIDYIFKWEQPIPGENFYRFWLSPATLVFEDVNDLQVHQPYPWYAGLTIIDVQRTELGKEQGTATHKKSWEWTLDCLEAGWVFSATGYRQFIRRPPVLVVNQRLTLDERNGYNFECPSGR